ncbi:M20 metallopeptidase family protein [Desulfomonile tiedjei]|uniref:Amidohydrolase n=1 Tax=Desulfomonile tiedjei (strain ATCC 49306 / DSM 6799 / DCB-1) TaxID=706587 RepID=I4C6H9_DESTA|nr:amidohydrolase [Desulfomonile tiedjei]AFM25170.1 amidohydrolase [Desulfomonile tiedjei DSM 6799]
MVLIPGIVAIHDEMIGWRHEFHRHPEISFHEHRTAAKVAELLRSFGLDEIVEGVGSTGVLGILKNDEGPVIALRADMDALAFSDQGQHDHKSTADGVTHACGHDGHVAMLLGSAKYLSFSRRFRGTVVFVFQPAEEVTGGAKHLLEQGFLERYGVQSIFAVHSFPGLAAGRISITPGTALAAVDNFKITITGRSGHAGAPHLARDPIAAAGAMISRLQTIATRTVDPIDSVVVAVTSIQSSSNLHNVIPESVRLKGTVRYLNPAYGKPVPMEMKAIVDGVAAAHGVIASIEYKRSTPPLINASPACEFATNVAKSLLGDDGVVQLPPMMGGEDFAYYLQRIPGVFAFIGNGEDSASLHNAAFDFNDKALPVGASYFVRMVETSLPL